MGQRDRIETRIRGVHPERVITSELSQRPQRASTTVSAALAMELRLPCIMHPPPRPALLRHRPAAG